MLSITTRTDDSSIFYVHTLPTYRMSQVCCLQWVSWRMKCLLLDVTLEINEGTYSPYVVRGRHCIAISHEQGMGCSDA